MKLEQAMQLLQEWRDVSRQNPSLLNNESYLFFDFCLKNIGVSNSQLFQDLFVLFTLNLKENGYFVDFGATNGIGINNTYLLEKRFGWTGIVAEPCKSWHRDLQVNRSCKIDLRCVWSKSDETMIFNQTSDAELSTINQFSDLDMHLHMRKVNNSLYDVETVSLNDLLSFHKAPKYIDFLSIDTEGSEYDILNVFDFNQFYIKVITVEHNYTPNRDKIHSLLSSHGFIRKFEEFSRFDDWYVNIN